jgi:hypothetical protein
VAEAEAGHSVDEPRRDGRGSAGPQVLMGGATGWGKSHAALATNLYQVYLLSCFDNPHALFRSTGDDAYRLHVHDRQSDGDQARAVRAVPRGVAQHALCQALDALG